MTQADTAIQQLCAPGSGTWDVNTALCTCKPTYFLPNCLEKDCPTKSATSTASCSGRGKCDTTKGSCTCFAPYTGASCEYAECPSGCGGHGTCDATLGVCSCTFGFAYPDCTSLSTPIIALIAVLAIVAIPVIVLTVIWRLAVNKYQARLRSADKLYAEMMKDESADDDGTGDISIGIPFGGSLEPKRAPSPPPREPTPEPVRVVEPEPAPIPYREPERLSEPEPVMETFDDSVSESTPLSSEVLVEDEPVREEGESAAAFRERHRVWKAGHSAKYDELIRSTAKRDGVPEWMRNRKRWGDDT